MIIKTFNVTQTLVSRASHDLSTYMLAVLTVIPARLDMIQWYSCSPFNYLGRGQTTDWHQASAIFNIMLSESPTIKKKKNKTKQNKTHHNHNLKFLRANTEHGTSSPWSQMTASTFCLGLICLGIKDDNLPIRKKGIFKIFVDENCSGYSG